MTTFKTLAAGATRATHARVIFFTTVLLHSTFWIIALFLPAFTATADPSASYSGFGCFLWGAVSTLFAMFNPMSLISPETAWLANIFAFVGLCFLAETYKNSSKLPSIFAVCAVLLASLAFFLHETVFYENGPTVPVVSGPAVYMWFASMVVLLVGAVTLYFVAKPEPALE